MNGQGTTKTCCAPARNEMRDGGKVNITSGRHFEAKDTVEIPGGPALDGTNAPQIQDDGESPARTVAVKPFRMAPMAVSNAEFRNFVLDTGYVTEAECFGWSFVFWAQVPEGVGQTEDVAKAHWWWQVHGASLFALNGPDTE